MANKAIFLDRDDTLIEDTGYINDPEQVKLLEGVSAALNELHNMGYKLVVVSNQSGVARGIVSEAVLGDIHVRLRNLLAEKGAYLDGIYYCPNHPDGVIAKYRKDDDWRKPKPGMLLAAAKDMDIELEQSWIVGNSGRDIKAGAAAGCRTILIDNPTHTKLFEGADARPDFRAVNIKEAVNIIKKYSRPSVSEPAVISQSITPAITGEPPKVQQETRIAEKPEAKKEEFGSNRVEELLGNILEQLRKSHRTNMFSEFSVTRLLAGIMQIVVLFCLLVSVWFLMSPERQDNSVMIWLSFSIIFQLMSLTFYMMQERK